MEKTTSLKALVVEKYNQLLRNAAQRHTSLLGRATPVPVVVRVSPPVRVPVTRRRRTYP